MQHSGLTQPLSQAGYYETSHNRQLLKDIRGAILEGRLIAVGGGGGSKTVTMRRLQRQLKEENKITVSKSLSVEQHSIKLATLIAALYYDLATDKQARIPRQGERRERELRELVRKNKRPGVVWGDGVIVARFKPVQPCFPKPVPVRPQALLAIRRRR